MMTGPKRATAPHRVELYTSHTRGAIVRALSEAGLWKGTRKGVRAKLTLSKQPDFENNRVAWSAKIGGRVYEGRAPSGFDALQAIQIALDKQRKENPNYEPGREPTRKD